MISEVMNEEVLLLPWIVGRSLLRLWVNRRLLARRGLRSTLRKYTGGKRNRLPRLYGLAGKGLRAWRDLHARLNPRLRTRLSRLRNRLLRLARNRLSSRLYWLTGQAWLCHR